MKRHEMVFGAVRLPLEWAAVFASFFAARDLRRVTDLVPGVQLPFQTIATPQLAGFAAAGATLAVSFLAARGLYRIRSTGSRLAEAGNVLGAFFSWFFAYVGALYLANGYLYSTQIPRLVLLFSAIFSVLAIVALRTALNFLQSSLLSRGVLEKRRAVLIMAEPDADVAAKFSSSAVYGLAGYVAFRADPAIPLPWLGTPDAAETAVAAAKPDDVFVAGTPLTPEAQASLFDLTVREGVRYAYFPNHADAAKRNVEMFFLGRTPVVEIRSVGIDAWGRVAKRASDLAGALALLPFALPVLAAALAATWLRDGKNPLYRSVRVGKGGVPFALYKVRSMVPDADRIKKGLEKANERTDGPLFKMENDPRVTPLGRFLRKTGIDELPQLWSVLRGDMSLVGPRPHLPEEVAKYLPWQRRVLSVKPGITGMAQVNGRHRNAFSREVELDALYIENWSFLLDAKILAKTVAAVFGRGA